MEFNPVKQRSKANPKWKGGELISSSLRTKFLTCAKKRAIPFHISIQDMEDIWLKQNGLCAYTGTELSLPKCERDRKFTASLDRIDSTKAYTKDNIQWVLKKVNIMKMSLSHQEFIDICKLVVSTCGV